MIAIGAAEEVPQQQALSLARQPRGRSLQDLPDQLLLHDADRRRGGAEVEIVTTAGPPRLRKDYASGRDNERLDVVQAQWTPDSAFFVFSVTNADGHQPWRFPVLFYSRAANAIHRLEDFSDGLSIVDPAFKVFAPDIVEVVGQTRIDRPSKTRRFRLSGPSAARRATPPPASGDDLNAGRK